MTNKSYAEALQHSHARLTHLIANLQGGVLVENENRHIALVNQTFCNMFSIPATPNQLVGVDCSNSAEESKLLFKNPDKFVKRVEVILERKQTVTDETLFLEDGRVFSRDYVPIYHDDTYSGHLWHYRDITETYRSQRRWKRMLKFEEVNKETNRLFLQLDDVDAALNQALEMTGQLLDVSRVYVFRFREYERILDNTHEWCAPGVKPEIDNLQGLPFDDIFPSFFPMIAEHDLIAPNHINDLPDDLRGVLEPQEIQTVLWMPFYLNDRIEGFIGYDETRHARTWLPEEITMARIIAESYARSLEREQVAKMLIIARDEALRTAQLRSQFVANMSHEIRTPMTGILGMLELLLETELDELQQEFTHEAFASSSRLLNIINDILDFSKMEAGQIVLESTPIDLQAVATEVKMTLVPQLKDKPVAVHLHLDSDIPHRVHGDATRLRQVLMNLVGNAIKFTDEGQVTLSVQVVRQTDDVAYLRFEVQDTGIGIPEAKIQRIFESFIQADGSTTRKYGGSGLGLSISKQLVELMGGALTVESEIDVGSKFSFSLQMPVAQASHTQSVDTVGFADLDVLLFDNNRTARYVLAQQLENWGVQLTQVHHVDELESQQQFDLAFLRSHAVKTGTFSPVALARQVVYITDGSVVPDEGRVCLQWPINQSVLHNLLVQALHGHTLPEPQATPQSTVTGRILLADDHPINTDLVKRALADMNVHLDCVKNGQQVLDRLAEHTYDLVLMDVHMPVMDGIEATHRIRAGEATQSEIPILALTASVMREEQDYYLTIGMNEVVSKPFSLHVLRAAVQKWLENR
jgi:signal transduction histidine kinase/CheY-like chemotaxis protein